MKTVVYSCPYVPAEWIAAHGLRPSRILPRSIGGTPPAGPTMGVCPYARAFLHEALTDSMADAIVLSTLCDQMRRSADLLAQGCESPVFLMNLPSCWQTAGAQRLYIEELKRLGRFLTRLGGAPPSNEALAATMLDYDAARAALRDARGRLPPRHYSEAIAEFHRTGQIKIDVPGPAPPVQGVPLALLGGPMLRDHFRLFDFIERAGGRVVLDGTDSGERTLPAPFDRRGLRDDPLMELAGAYFGSIPHAFRRPNSELFRWLKRAVAERGVRGIILRRYVWCDIWHAEVQRVREWSGLAVLDIDVNSDESAEGRTANRIEAFLEILR